MHPKKTFLPQKRPQVKNSQILLLFIVGTIVRKACIEFREVWMKIDGGKAKYLKTHFLPQNGGPSEKFKIPAPFVVDVHPQEATSQVS